MATARSRSRRMTHVDDFGGDALSAHDPKQSRRHKSGMPGMSLHSYLAPEALPLPPKGFEQRRFRRCRLEPAPLLHDLAACRPLLLLLRRQLNSGLWHRACNWFHRQPEGCPVAAAMPPQLQAASCCCWRGARAAERWPAAQHWPATCLVAADPRQQRLCLRAGDGRVKEWAGEVSSPPHEAATTRNTHHRYS